MSTRATDAEELGIIRPAWKPRSRRWLALVTVVLALVVPTCGAIGYWRSVNYVPIFVLSLPPDPVPKGYQAAVRAVRQLPGALPPGPNGTGASHPAGLPAKWETAPATQLAAALRAAAPAMDGVRRTFSSAWRASPWRAPSRLEGSTADLNGFRALANYLAAESRLARLRGDPAGALRSSLDVIELGNRCTDQGWQEMGMEQAERCADAAPLPGLAAQLKRTRRLRLTWRRATETLEIQRQEALAGLTEGLREISTRTLWQQLDEAEQVLERPVPAGSGPVFGHGWGAWQAVLTPRSQSVAALDRYYRAMIVRASAPIREGSRTVPLTDPWATPYGTAGMGGYRWEWPRHNLALLETSLAVRLFRLEHGRYPAALREIERERLPKIPVDAWDQPIAYRLKNGRPVIYSLGRDGIDDGGRAADPATFIEHGTGDAVWGRLCSSDWPRKR